MLSIARRISFSPNRHQSYSSVAESVKTRLAALPKAKTPPKTIPAPPRKKPRLTPTPEAVVRHREAMKESFPNGWNPPRKLSRDAMDGLRTLHAHNPEQFSTPVLADKFKISPEAVRRILKSNWQPSSERRAEILSRERKAKLELTVERRRKEWEEAKRALDSQSSRRKQPEDGLEFT